LILIIAIILVFSVAITFVVPVQSSTSSNLSKLMIAGNQLSEAGTLIDDGTIVQVIPLEKLIKNLSLLGKLQI